MKKIVLSSVLILSLLMSLAACGSTSQPQQPVQTQAPEVEATQPSVAATDASIKIPEVTTPTVVLEPEGSMGDFYVKITGFELFEDHSGYPSILIVYSFTNNSQESTAPMYEVATHAYQNGVELSDASTYGLDDYDFGISMTKIQPGTTIDIPAVYRLSSETAPVEFDIVENFAIYPSVVGDVFEISEGGETVLSQAPQGVMDFDVGTMHISVVSYRITTDYNGNAVLVLELGVTNNGTKSDVFGASVALTAFQNGVELASAYMVDGVDIHTRTAYLRPGVGVTVYCSYVLQDESTVSFEMSELISFDNTVYSFTIDLEK